VVRKGEARRERTLLEGGDGRTLVHWDGRRRGEGELRRLDTLLFVGGDVSVKLEATLVVEVPAEERVRMCSNGVEEERRT
jgi:hypothetical protein